MHTSFKQFLVEEEKTVYFTFGRMNPPTIGHGKLLDTLAKKAAKNPFRVFLSQSNDPKKNPLTYQDKVKAVRKMFPRHARFVMYNKKIKNAMDAASSLYDEGFKNVVMVVGSDRINEFSALLQRYNGKEGRHGFYNFKKINVISAGDRDPDAEGVEGMSASKMRGFAQNNDFTSFSQGLPKTVSNPDAKKIFNDVRKGMGLKEETEFKNHIQLDPVSDIREAYIRDNIFEKGEQVVITDKGIVGKISYLGSNYLIVESKGETWRCWLDGVSKLDPNDIPPGHVEADFGATPEKGVYSLNEEVSLDEAARWKRAGPNGEIEINHKGQKYKIEKALDHNERHRGEFKIMVWDKRSRSWEWDNTVQGKSYAKELVMDKLDEDRWYKDQPEWGTPESTKKAKQKTPGEMKEAERKKDSPQDPDIKDRPGTQPKAYHAGLSKKTKKARDAHFKRGAKMDDGNPKAYKKAPGDATAKTKPSKHTLRFKQMFGEEDDTHVDRIKNKINKEKERDKRKHDRMMDIARIRDTQAKNKATR